MNIRPSRWLVPALAIALAATTRPAASQIFGEDDRFESFELSKQQRAYSDAVAVIAPRSNFAGAGPRLYWKLESFTTLGQRRFEGKAVDDVAQFNGQPCGGVGTAFLIAPDLVMTAGHCVVDDKGESVIKDKLVVFGFALDPATQRVPALARPRDVYRIVETIAVDYDPAKNVDYAIVRLDRDAEGRRPLALRQEGRVADGAPLLMVGHPYGLPQKVSINARVAENAPEAFFRTDLDAFPGNSGSPVLDARTGVVEGILVRGRRDAWDLDAATDKVSPKRYRDDQAATLGTEVQRVATIPAIARGVLASRELFDLLRAGRSDDVIAGIERGLDARVLESGRRTLLHVAQEVGDLKVTRYLIDRGLPVAPRDRDGYTPLHYAVRAGRSYGVAVLLQKGHPVNLVSTRGETALFLLDRGGQEPMGVRHALAEAGAEASILPKYVADANTLVRDAGGVNGRLAKERVMVPPLTVAVERNDAALVTELIARGADTRALDARKYTPLHCAATFGHVEAARALLAAGADPNAFVKGVWTPLHLAAHSSANPLMNNRRHAEVAAVLLEGGADPNYTVRSDPRYDVLPLDLASGGTAPDADVVHVLKQAGGQRLR